MSVEHLKRIVIALAVVIGLWALVAVFGGRETDDLEGLVIVPMTPGAVDRVEVFRSGDTIVLSREPDASWTVNGFRASVDEVDGLFAVFEDSMISSELVARSSTSHTRMGIDDAAGRRVTFSLGGAPVSELIVGDAGQQFETGFIRLPEADEVYLVRGRLNTLIDREAEAWRDREIASIDTSGVASIQFARGGSQYSITRSDAAWQIGEATADSLTVARVLTELAGLQASGFPTAAQMDSVDFSQSERSMAVLDADGTDLLRVNFDSTASWFWAQRETRAAVYRVDRWRVDRLVPEEDALRGTSP